MLSAVEEAAAVHSCWWYFRWCDIENECNPRCTDFFSADGADAADLVMDDRQVVLREPPTCVDNTLTELLRICAGYDIALKHVLSCEAVEVDVVAVEDVAITSL